MKTVEDDDNSGLSQRRKNGRAQIAKLRPSAGWGGPLNGYGDVRSGLRFGAPGRCRDAARAGEFPRDLLHALGSLAHLPRYREVKRVDLGSNILAIERELIGDLNQLVRDNPADATSHRDRNQDRGENR